MLRKIIAVCLSVVFFSTIAFAEGWEEDGDTSDSGTAGAIGNFKYDPDLSAEGIRCSLFRGDVYVEGKTFNILNKEPAENGSSVCIYLGDKPKTKTSSLSIGSWGVQHIDRNFPGLTSDAEARKDYLQNDNAIVTYANAFGVPADEIRRGSYSVLIEPIAQIRVGNPDSTIIGTPTEIALYILTDTQYLGRMSSQYNSTFTAQQWDDLMYSESPNLFHRRIPSSMYLTQGKLGLSAGSAGIFHSSQIRQPSFGSGAFILYKGNPCPYNGAFPHGGREAKTTPETGQPPCVCPEIITGGPTGNIIPKDYINYIFKTESEDYDTGDDYNGCDPEDSSSGMTDKSHEETGDYEGYWNFIGDRSYTSSPTELVVSKAHITTEPNIITSSAEFGFTYEGTHGTDRDGEANAQPPSVTTYWEEEDEDGDDYEYEREVDFPTSNYTAEPTVFEVNKSVVDRREKEYNYSRGNKTVITLPLGNNSTYNLSPSYKMKYYPSVGDQQQDIWMVASGIRTFTTRPYMQITATQPTVSALSPWSRDYEDLQSEMNTTKAGNAMKLSLARPIEYEVKIVYFMKDPFFTNGTSGAYSTNQDYVRAVEYVADNLSNLHITSNVPFTGDKTELITNNLGLAKIHDTTKTLVNDVPETKSKTNVNVKVSRSNFQGGIESLTQTTFNGNKITSGEAIPEISTLIVSGKDGWYNEDYEGLLKVVITQKVTVTHNSDNWFEIYRGISDWQTKNNEITNTIAPWGTTIYNGKNFVMGYGGYVPANSFGSAIIPAIPVYTDLYQFKIRGSAFDQH